MPRNNDNAFLFGTVLAIAAVVMLFRLAILYWLPLVAFAISLAFFYLVISERRNQVLYGLLAFVMVTVSGFLFTSRHAQIRAEAEAARQVQTGPSPEERQEAVRLYAQRAEIVLTLRDMGVRPTETGAVCYGERPQQSCEWQESEYFERASSVNGSDIDFSLIIVNPKFSRDLLPRGDIYEGLREDNPLFGGRAHYIMTNQGDVQLNIHSRASRNRQSF